MDASGVTVPWFEDVVVDRFVDQADLPRVDLEMVVDLGTQAVGIDNDRVSEADRALVVQTAVGARTNAHCLRNGERVMVFMWMTSERVDFITGAIAVLSRSI